VANIFRASLHGRQVSEEYLEHLLVLARKIAFINSNDAARGSQARRDVEAVLEKLRNRAIAKVKHRGPVTSLIGKQLLRLQAARWR
jgi:hypothetical protein